MALWQRSWKAVDPGTTTERSPKSRHRTTRQGTPRRAGADRSCANVAPEVWLYRGAWQEWAIHEATWLVPLSQEELRLKIQAIFKHQSQKDSAPFPGGYDDREFWQRVEARNKGTAADARPARPRRVLRDGSVRGRVDGDPLRGCQMRGLNGLDFVVIAAYLIGITALGIYVGRKQKDSKDYFVADRSIPWWAVMISVVASETSALTFISIPGLAYVGQSRVPRGRDRLSARPHRRRDGAAAALLPGRAGHRVRAARDAIRPGDAPLHVDRLHGHARHGRLGARLRHGGADRAHHRPAPADGGGDADGGAGARHADGDLHHSRRNARRRLDGDRAGVGLSHRRHLGAGTHRPRSDRRMEHDPRHRPRRRPASFTPSTSTPASTGRTRCSRA